MVPAVVLLLLWAGLALLGAGGGRASQQEGKRGLLGARGGPAVRHSLRVLVSLLSIVPAELRAECEPRGGTSSLGQLTARSFVRQHRFLPVKGSRSRGYHLTWVSPSLLLNLGGSRIG